MGASTKCLEFWFDGLVTLELSLHKLYEKATNQTGRCGEQENHLTGKKISSASLEEPTIIMNV